MATLEQVYKLSIKWCLSARLALLIQLTKNWLVTILNLSVVTGSSYLTSPGRTRYHLLANQHFFSTLDSRRDAGTASHHICFVWQQFVLVSLQLSHYCKCRRHACYPLKGIWLDLRGNGASVTEANSDNGGPVYVWRGHAGNYQCPPYTWDRNGIIILSTKARALSLWLAILMLDIHRGFLFFKMATSTCHNN